LNEKIKIIWLNKYPEILIILTTLSYYFFSQLWQPTKHQTSKDGCSWNNSTNTNGKRNFWESKIDLFTFV